MITVLCIVAVVEVVWQALLAVVEWILVSYTLFAPVAGEFPVARCAEHVVVLIAALAVHVTCFLTVLTTPSTVTGARPVILRSSMTITRYITRWDDYVPWHAFDARAIRMALRAGAGTAGLVLSVVVVVVQAFAAGEMRVGFCVSHTLLTYRI